VELTKNRIQKPEVRSQKENLAIVRCGDRAMWRSCDVAIVRCVDRAMWRSCELRILLKG